MRTHNGTIYCDVIGCREEADHIDKANPFDSAEKCDLCERCLTAGIESVEKGYSEMPADILYHYYGLNSTGPSGYQPSRKLMEKGDK